MKKQLILLFLSAILSVSCKNSMVYEVSQVSGRSIPVSDSIPAHDSISEFIQPYKEYIDREMNAVLAYSPTDLVKTDGELNTALGNMMADAVMELANPVFEKRTGNSIDIVLLNHGGIRSSVEKGDITTRTAFQLMPFENEVVVAKMKGSAVRDLVRYLIDAGVAHPIAGLQLVLNSNNAIEKLLVQGEPVQEEKDYFVATNDYLLQGGDNMIFFSKANEVTSLNYKIRNLLIDYFSKHDTIAPVKDQRFIRLK
ncbi:5'-nucleotidase [Salinimicrobium catena]|uniref:5'-nucleotidase n=1 Tax=Salinimicrobium catena TaxID=390640 RepID=UPI002FE4A397